MITYISIQYFFSLLLFFYHASDLGHSIALNEFLCMWDKILELSSCVCGIKFYFNMDSQKNDKVTFSSKESYDFHVL